MMGRGTHPPSRAFSGDIFMSIDTSPQSSYQIQSSPDLKTWTPYGANQKAVNNSIFWINSNIAIGKNFYRVLENSN